MIEAEATADKLPRTDAAAPGRLSIIVPALEEAGAIAATLQSLSPARRRGAEIIVVDGGSRDATVEIAKNLSDRVVLAARGRALQLNAGAAVATGNVLLFVHADSKLPEDADVAVLGAIGDRTLAWGHFDVSIESKRLALRTVAWMMNVRSRATGIATGDQGIFATRALFDRAGRFPLQPLMEDIAFSRNAKRISAPMCLRPKIATSSRRWERRGIARTVLLMWRLRAAYFLGADPAELSNRYDQVR